MIYILCLTFVDGKENRRKVRNLTCQPVCRDLEGQAGKLHRAEEATAGVSLQLCCTYPDLCGCLSSLQHVAISSVRNTK